MNELQAAASIACEAGDQIRLGFGSMSFLPKGDFDIVTGTDLAASQLISQRLKQHFPGDAIICEESGHAAGGSGRVWYVDPLDGTKNFARGIGHFCTILAREEGGLVQLAVIHDPLRGETFTAQRGKGAWLNGERLEVSAPATLERSMVASGFPSSKRHAGLDAAPFHRVCQSVQALRRSGSTGLDLAYVAAGRYDAIWDWGLEPWDVAAGLLLVEEAGGLCTDWQGVPYRLGTPGLIAASPWLLPSLVTCLH